MTSKTPANGKVRPRRRAAKGSYGAAQIQVLEGLEAVRRRPGMYIGATDQRGLHHLVYEIVDNAVDEAMAGHCSRIGVTLEADGSVTVTDDGRGIPVDTHAKTGLSGVETVLTTLHAGGKFGGGGYQVSGGLHGVGASVVNALSERLDVTVAQGDTLHRQRYHRGVPAGPLRATPAMTSRSGTTVQFLADSSIFELVEYDATTLAERFREMAYLNADLRITLHDKRPGRPASRERFQFKTGIEAFVQHRNAEREVLHPRPLVLMGTRDGDQAEVALQYHAEFSEDVHSFANGIRTADGGTHMTGFRSGLTRVVNEYARRARLLKDDEPNLSGEDTREGLAAVVSVRLREPQFEGQTKGRLGNPETKTLVESTVATQLATLFAERPRVARAIATKALTAARARAAARRARDLVQRKSLIEHSALPGKLADCSGTNPEDCEIYLVEGESAGGTARSARDRRYQAILPLRGKILNVEKARHEKMLEHEEIRAIITALGAGFGERYGAARLRYHKVVIMTDADVDGAHIRTLLLTFFWRHLPDLVRGGNLFIAQPPLFSITLRGRTEWLFSEQERVHYAAEHPQRAAAGRMQRYKGLGEMNAEQLWATTMDPERRSLLRVGVHDEHEADQLFTRLMGNEVEPRRAFIFEHALDAVLDV